MILRSLAGVVAGRPCAYNMAGFLAVAFGIDAAEYEARQWDIRRARLQLKLEG